MPARIADKPFPHGPLNAVTDVAGVRVGHATVHEGDLHTGVTVVMPPGADEGATSLPWGLYAVGGGLEITGLAVLEDFGLLGSPIFIAPLVSVGRIYDGALTFAFGLAEGLPVGSGWPPVVIGFDDGTLSDPRRRALGSDHALEAIRNARGGPVLQGSVGAGAGAVAFGFKGGVGTASRMVAAGGVARTVGVLSLAHYGKPGDLGTTGGGIVNHAPAAVSVVATDAPLAPRHLDRLAERVAAGWQRIAPLAGSGLAVTFAAETPAPRAEPPADLFESLMSAAADAAAESIRSAVLSAEPATGRNGRHAAKIPPTLLEGP